MKKIVIALLTIAVLSAAAPTLALEGQTAPQAP